MDWFLTFDHCFSIVSTIWNFTKYDSIILLYRFVNHWNHLDLKQSYWSLKKIPRAKFSRDTWVRIQSLMHSECAKICQHWISWYDSANATCQPGNEATCGSGIDPHVRRNCAPFRVWFQFRCILFEQSSVKLSFTSRTHGLFDHFFFPGDRIARNARFDKILFAETRRIESANFLSD